MNNEPLPLSFKMRAKEALADAGYTMHAVLTITQMLDYWEKTGKGEQNKITETRIFLEKSR